VLGDQLDRNADILQALEPDQDIVWMAENETEATHVWCHKQRLVQFFSAMRHFRDALKTDGFRVEYHQLEADRRRDSGRDFGEILAASIRRLKPARLVVTRPGDWRVQQMLQATADDFDLPLDIVTDAHFYDTPEQFAEWAEDRKTLILEDYYREMRKQHGVLLDDSGPAGGQWNFDRDNRDSFGKNGPEKMPNIKRVEPDAVTREVMDLVEARYPDHPGHIEGFDQPVTAAQASAALTHFIRYRLPDFGRWQDALWTGEHFLNHSRLSPALNLHLLNPRDCVAAAERAWQQGDAPLNSVEGFIRQILGWREFVRGVYWLKMPDYIDANELNAKLPVPQAYWDGDTDMRCIAEAMTNVIEHGYAHHIQRLMILGLFAQVAGVNPKAFHEWHMAMYLDAVDWASLPNALGMSQYGDGGVVGTKPYCASGNYINKMSNYCKHCRFNYKQPAGDDACPVTTLYWDFLDRHAEQFRDNRRMVFQMKNLDKKRGDQALMQAIRKQASTLQQTIKAGERL
jgi:deoxyribodipyrimidine photolyase-related protein